MVPVPPADMKAGFFSPYFIVPKKSGGVREKKRKPDQSRAILLAARVGAKAVSLHPQVYVAAIAANHDPVEGKSVGKHD